MQIKEWQRGKCFTFRGAGRVWWSYDAACRSACGEIVRGFDTETDALQWLFAMRYA